MKKNTIITFVVSLMLLFLLAGCAGTAAPQQETPQPEAESVPEEPGEQQQPSDTASSGDPSEFVYAIEPPKISLDPIHTFTSTEAQVYTALFEGLVTYHPFTLEPLPAVAKRWEVSPDGTLYTFYIRESAKYSNGDPILAGHLKDSWLTLIDPEEQAEYSSLLDIVKNARDYRSGNITDPDEVGIRVKDDRTLEVELEHPATHFLRILCHHSFAPVHPSILEEVPTDTPTELISNGPYYIAESGQDYLLLKRNQLYWDSSSVRIEKLRIVYRDDPQEITTEFNKDNIQWVDGNVNVDQLTNRDAVVVNPLFATSYFFFSARSQDYADPGVRRALALLFPWSAIRSQEYMYLPTSSLVPSIGSYPEVQGIEQQNAEEALRMLEEYGYPEGEGLPKIKIALPEGEESLRIGDHMKSAIEEHLVTEVEIEQYPFHQYYEVLKQEPFTIGTLTWIGDFADPLTFLQMWTSDSSLNLSAFSDSKYDELIEESMRQDRDARFEILSEAEKHLLEGAIVMPIKNSPAFNVIDLDHIEGWFPNPLDIHPFKYLGYAQPTLPEGVVMAPRPYSRQKSRSRELTLPLKASERTLHDQLPPTVPGVFILASAPSASGS